VNGPVEPSDTSCESREDLQACEREMWELDNTKDQIMTLLKVGLANLGMWVRDVRRVGAYEILTEGKGG
jgi:hypothetical protein